MYRGELGNWLTLFDICCLDCRGKNKALKCAVRGVLARSGILTL